MDENFLLTTPMAQKLYHECAENLPLIDYHNHLSIDELNTNKQFENLTKLWISNDPYKHRAMRICGVDERYITGKSSDFEKFQAWTGVLPRLICNPLYDWSILELKRVFKINLIPNRVNCQEIWDETSKILATSDFSALGMFSRFNVEYAAPCTAITDDTGSFGRYKNIAPSLRGDNITDITPSVVKQLGDSIETLDDLFVEIARRLNSFHEVGCRFSDHALDNGFKYYEDDGQNKKRFKALINGTHTDEDAKHLSSEILRRLAKEYARLNWTMQLHIGAQRYTSSRLRSIVGPAGGFAGIGNCCNVKRLTTMLDDFEKDPNGLPNILLFTLNPADNAVMSILSGSYNQSGKAGKVQQGPAWWWCDHLYGIREVFETISAYGVLDVFIGMTTDSRSILSMARHEYFRRALCGWLGEKAERGEAPNSFDALENLVHNICYRNARIRIGELS